MFRVTMLGDSNGDFNQGAGGEFRYGCVRRACIVQKVKGEWVRRQVIAVPGSLTYTVGTTAKHKETRTSEWAMSAKIAIEAGVEIKDTASYSTKYSVELSRKISNAYSQEFAKTTQVKRTYEFPQQSVGKQLWQFVFYASDTCRHSEITDVDEFALTAGAFEPPCCIPGWATDAPTYRFCKNQESMIKGLEGKAQEGCQVSNAV